MHEKGTKKVIQLIDIEGVEDLEDPNIEEAPYCLMIGFYKEQSLTLYFEISAER